MSVGNQGIHCRRGDFRSGKRQAVFRFMSENGNGTRRTDGKTMFTFPTTVPPKFLKIGNFSFFARFRKRIPPGQTFTQFPQPIHFSVSTTKSARFIINTSVPCFCCNCNGYFYSVQVRTFLLPGYLFVTFAFIWGGMG